MVLEVAQKRCTTHVNYNVKCQINVSYRCTGFMSFDHKRSDTELTPITHTISKKGRLERKQTLAFEIEIDSLSVNIFKSDQKVLYQCLYIYTLYIYICKTFED